MPSLLACGDAHACNRPGYELGIESMHPDHNVRVLTQTAKLASLLCPECNPPVAILIDRSQAWLFPWCTCLQMITLGGDAELELVDSLDPFSEVRVGLN